MNTLDRIAFNTQIMGGQACIRGTRIPVSVVVTLVASGMTTQAILRDYPDLEVEDVQQALKYAAWITSEQILPAHTRADHY